MADVIDVCLAYLNWLEKDAADAFKRALEKHREAMQG